MLDAVVGPEARGVRLGRVERVGDGGVVDEGLLPRVRRGKGDVSCWVPIFGCDLEREGELEQGVDGGDGGAAVGDCEGAVLYWKEAGLASCLLLYVIWNV